jgi:hypothetical protein
MKKWHSTVVAATGAVTPIISSSVRKYVDGKKAKLTVVDLCLYSVPHRYLKKHGNRPIISASLGCILLAPNLASIHLCVFRSHGRVSQVFVQTYAYDMMKFANVMMSVD